jgi:hypothetical protein
MTLTKKIKHCTYTRNPTGIWIDIQLLSRIQIQIGIPSAADLQHCILTDKLLYKFGFWKNK